MSTFDIVPCFLFSPFFSLIQLIVPSPFPGLLFPFLYKLPRYRDTLACYERDPNASQEMLKLSFENEPDWPPLDLKVIHNYYTQVTLRREKKSTQRALKDFRAYFLRDAGKIYLYGKVQSLKFNYYRDVFGEMTVTVDEDGQLVVDKVCCVDFSIR